MRIRELTLQNFRVFERVDLELPARVIGIFGPNGAGKSTLVEAIQFACYGKSRSAKQEIRTHGLLTDCVVDLVFEHGGKQYRVLRTIRGKNHATDAALYAGDLQLATGVTDVDAEIRRLLRMDHQVFRASVFAEQKQLDAFSDITKGERRKMVLRLLGIRPIETALTAARKGSRETKEQADRLAGMLPEVAGLEKALAEARTEENRAGAAAKDAADALKEATARSRAAAKAFESGDRVREQAERLAVEREGLVERAADLAEQADELTKHLDELTQDLEELPALREEAKGLADVGERLDAARRLHEAAAEVGELEQQVNSIPDVDAERVLADLQAAQEALAGAQETAGRAQAAHERSRSQVAHALGVLERAGELDPSAPCPTCGQELGAGFESYLTHCRDEVRHLKAEETTAAKELKRADAARRAAGMAQVRASKKAEQARTALDRRASLTDRLQDARSRRDELVEMVGEERPDLPALEAGAARSTALARRIAELETEAKQLSRAKADLERVSKAISLSATRIEEIDAKAAALAFEPEDHARLRKERDEAERLLDDARDFDRGAQETLNRIRTEIARIEGQVEQAHEAASKVDVLRDDARYLERVSLLLDGFRDHLVSRIGPELSREAEAIFHDLTNHEYEDLKIDDDTLAIHIADAGTYFPIERFSGSESDLANLALRVAISMHLSRVSGADVGMMVLDEVLGALDAERKDLMVQTMGRLSSRFHQLFVITHAEQVKDQFPASIEVRKLGRRRSEALLV